MPCSTCVACHTVGSAALPSRRAQVLASKATSAPHPYSRYGMHPWHASTSTEGAGRGGRGPHYYEISPPSLVLRHMQQAVPPVLLRHTRVVTAVRCVLAAAAAREDTTCGSHMTATVLLLCAGSEGAQTSALAAASWFMHNPTRLARQVTRCYATLEVTVTGMARREPPTQGCSCQVVASRNVDKGTDPQALTVPRGGVRRLDALPSPPSMTRMSRQVVMTLLATSTTALPTSHFATPQHTQCQCHTDNDASVNAPPPGLATSCTTSPRPGDPAACPSTNRRTRSGSILAPCHSANTHD